jgi:hypothetical protein
MSCRTEIDYHLQHQAQELDRLLLYLAIEQVVQLIEVRMD